MRRTIFRVIKNPKATTDKESRLAIVDFHDSYGMLKLDIPELPRGTVIDVGKSNKNIPLDECWNVVDYQGPSSNLAYRDAKLKNIKDGLAD